jgi:hypothetical protein
MAGSRSPVWLPKMEGQLPLCHFWRIGAGLAEYAVRQVRQYLWPSRAWQMPFEADANLFMPWPKYRAICFVYVACIWFGPRLNAPLLCLDGDRHSRKLAENGVEAGFREISQVAELMLSEFDTYLL